MRQVFIPSTLPQHDCDFCMDNHELNEGNNAVVRILVMNEQVDVCTKHARELAEHLMKLTSNESVPT